MPEDSKPASKRGAHLAAHRFKPGQSGNPGGVGVVRPKGLAARIREATNDGETLVAFLTSLAHGEEKSGTMRDRVEAAKILLDRGYGKALETSVTVTATADEALELAAVADRQLEGMLTALRSRSAPSVPTLKASPDLDALHSAEKAAESPPALEPKP